MKIPTKLQEINDYLATLELRNYSPETITKYRQVLEQLAHYCSTNNLDLLTITQKDIRQFRGTLKEKGLKAVSINGYTDVLKTFFEHLKKNQRPDNPARKIPRHKQDKLQPSNVKEKELLDLLDAIDKDPTLSVTDLTMFEILLGTGMRVSEMCNLDIVDIEEWGRVPTKEDIKKFAEKFPKKPLPDWIPGIIHIRVAKGGYARKVPFLKFTEIVLKKYLQVREQNNFTSPYLFCNLSGGRMNRGNVYKIIKPFLDLTTSPKKGPHTLRHTYASHLINRGANIAVVKDLLGHKSVRTTQLYTHVDIEAKIRIHQAAHPRA
ncbi:MAG TPA: tyrosine-type recombinase/integrase [Chitinophagaceae bacterium]|nr:tyrosine-type recombinase/integrase [Chitinophagaceae bacterium]